MWIFNLAYLSRIALALFTSFACAGSALANCGLPQEVTALIDTLNAATQEHAGHYADWPARLRKDAAKVNMARVNEKLFSVGVDNRKGTIDALLKDVDRIQRQGGAVKPHTLREHVRKAERLHNLVCKLEEIENKKQSSQDSPDIGQARANMAVPYSLENISDMAKLAILLGAASFLVLLIVLGKIVYDWAFALTHNRRSCRIPAILEQGLDVVDGHLTILGVRGCRFCAVNEGAHARIVQLAEGDHRFTVQVGKLRAKATLAEMGPSFFPSSLRKISPRKPSRSFLPRR